MDPEQAYLFDLNGVRVPAIPIPLP
eukprot:COSAG04_NODE_1187_length_7847_cov_3.494579_1_plen_24_part_10